MSDFNRHFFRMTAKQRRRLTGGRFYAYVRARGMTYLVQSWRPENAAKARLAMYPKFGISRQFTDIAQLQTLSPASPG